MARLNLEDSFWLDIMTVAVGLGSVDLAIGNAVRFIRVSQEYFKLNKPMSLEDFKNQGFSEALIPLFAVVTDSVVVARGGDKQFSWLLERQKAGKKGGTKSSQSKSEAAKKREEKKRAEKEHKQPQATTSKSKQPQPSYSYSYSKELNTLCSNEHGTDFCFEEVFNKYPKRNGSQNKKKGIQTLTKQIKNKEDYDLLVLCVSNYRTWCDREQKTGTQFVAQFSTFANAWREWVEIPGPTTKPTKTVSFA